jgi:hypothetical protein
MISNFIVISSIILALIFTLAWLARPSLRKRIEAPKHFFQEQLQQYNRELRDTRNSNTVPPDGQ